MNYKYNYNYIVNMNNVICDWRQPLASIMVQVTIKNGYIHSDTDNWRHIFIDVDHYPTLQGKLQVIEN